MCIKTESEPFVLYEQFLFVLLIQTNSYFRTWPLRPSKQRLPRAKDREPVAVEKRAAAGGFCLGFWLCRLIGLALLFIFFLGIF